VTNFGSRDGLDFIPPADGYPQVEMFGWR